MRLMVLALAIGTCLGPVCAGAESRWDDTFAAPLRYERQAAYAWSAGRGRFRATDEAARLIPPLPALDQATVRAELTVSERTGSQWTTAGIALYLDAANSWQLLLVEAPDGRRYFEVIENLDGVHQAQSPGQATSLAMKDEGNLESWKPGKRYALQLTLAPAGIVGVVREEETGHTWTRSFAFSGSRALRRGRPALVAVGTAGTFHRFSVDAPAEQKGSSAAQPTRGKAGSTVVVADRDPTIANRLAQELRKAGFGAAVWNWDRVASSPLPDRGLDLLVLANARRMPLPVRDAVMRRLHAGQAVMAIGAPAGSELLARSPEGWMGRTGWLEAYARRLPRSPLHVQPTAWRRAALNPSRKSTISPDPAEGPTCWRLDIDLQGWDAWYTDAEGAFGRDRTALVFELKADATVPHVAVECVEKDGSRWFAVVPGTTTWRHHVLRPADFAYWNDSPTRNRGHAGDRFQPSALARISFGLSSSHTPKVKPGPHWFRLRGLSTAAEDRDTTPDFALADLEALWPSYKLYPMDSIAVLRASTEQGIVSPTTRVAWSHSAFSPVWRERGRGYGRNRAWRWIPVLEAFDRTGRKRGAIVSVMLGDASWPGATWVNVAVADPAHALRSGMLEAVVATAAAAARGAFLLEGGAECFSYRRGESVVIGARARSSPSARDIIEARVTDATGATVFTARAAPRPARDSDVDARWTWNPKRFDARGYTVAISLLRTGTAIDRIIHRIEALRETPARPEEFVRVSGSGFTLGGKPWYFQGINYWPTWMAGYPSLNQRNRECYDPEIIERDLAYLRSAGVNALSAIQCIVPPDLNAPHAFRDQLDFLDRCLRHGIRCYMTLHTGRPYRGADFARIKDYIERAELRNHPAVMCWELAWEPIEGAWNDGLVFLTTDWNHWIVERYGSVGAAVADWGFDPRPGPDASVPTPTMQQCTASGPWNRFVAAFARAFSDLIGRAYGEVVRPLREWDPNHLISFRGGACGVPSGPVFAHIHSVGVARHMDFLCPEGYNLQTGGWANPSPRADIRKGGLVTQYYRWVSREKPVVWMEFGYTVNGFSTVWTPDLVRIKASELERQRDEVEWFYAMFIESGARGAAPWWLPGGFRLGENSDFGLVEPDGTERPSGRVMRTYNPRFASVVHKKPDAVLQIDLDGRRWSFWDTYGPQYLALIEAGRTPELRTAGTGTTSADCPLVAVGGTPYNGHNPPQYLNAEFDSLEVRIGDGPWRTVRDGDRIEAPSGSTIQCRARVGNTGEAGWLSGTATGGVCLAGRPEYGLAFRAPIASDTPYLSAAQAPEFTLIPSLSGTTGVSFEMEAIGRAFFGERRTVTFVTP